MLDNYDGRLNDGGGLPYSSDDEGGLRAPPDLHGWRKAWWWFHFLILVKLARLRFIGILVVIGVVITQWDTLLAYYDRWSRPPGGADAVASDIEYFCPMHPTVVRDNDREKCPICFMPLSKRKKGTGEPEALPAGVVNRVQLTPYRIVLAGVQTYPVDYQPLVKEISAVGYIEFNERAQRTISARVAGRIDKLVANETGRMVQAGDELAWLYSPELVVTVENLLNAKRDGNEDLLKSARTRLERWGIDDRQLDEILAAGKSDTRLKIRSPISGHIITKYVREGQYVEEGTPLYDMADLSTVWMEAQVYEDDMAFLPADMEQSSQDAEAHGLEVTATTRAFPDEVFHGKLALIYPHVDEDTRTVTVRFEVDNPHPHKLRPGATATISIRVLPRELAILGKAAGDDPAAQQMLAEGRVLAVPEGSVIDTGSQRIVYREASSGVYEGVEVALGSRMRGPGGASYYPVLRGLTMGDAVVNSGSFLVDAETRLNPAAGSLYFGGSGGSSTKHSSVTTVRPSTPEDPDAKIEAALASLSSEDRALVDAQRYCPVLTDNRLGVMGAPVKLMIRGKPVFVCCSGCTEKALADPDATRATVEKLIAAGPLEPKHNADDGMSVSSASDQETAITSALAELPPDELRQAKEQKFCVVLPKNRLGAMGPPIKLLVDGEPVFICCEGCRKAALKDPQATLMRLARLKQPGSTTSVK